MENTTDTVASPRPFNKTHRKAVVRMKEEAHLEGYHQGFEEGRKHALESQQVRIKAVECASRIAMGVIGTDTESLLNFADRLVRYIEDGRV